jgi:ubiquinone/menaquinone biosynthesis C-methylase UbiE
LVKPADVFDTLAQDYDRDFGRTLGQLYRRAAWRWLDRAFQPGDHVLEMSCGTGEDALHLSGRGVRVLATDPSEGMLEVARSKLPPAEPDTGVTFHQLAIEQVGALAAEYEGHFDGAFSNFGGLNFVKDIREVSRSLARLLKPGAPVVLCVVGRFVPWEWAWFVAQRQPRKAFRRLGKNGAVWKGVRVWYPTIRQTIRAFAAEFRVRRRGGLGMLLPPPYAEAWGARHPRLLETLYRWERRVESWPATTWLGDHYLVELQRK